MFGEPELSSDTSISRFARCLYLSPIVRGRAVLPVPGNCLPASHGIQDIEACRRHSRFCYYGVNQIEDTATIYKPNSMPIGPVSTPLSMVVLLLRNRLV